jgi:tetratricopeptide (TPR) repeat protein
MAYNSSEITLQLSESQKQILRDINKAFALYVADKKDIELAFFNRLSQELKAALEAQPDWTYIQEQAKNFRHQMLHLVHEESDLLSLPWHITPYNNRFIHISKGFSLRNASLESFEPEKVLPLKILVVIAMPDDLEEKERLNHESEIESLIEAFDTILADAQVEIDFANDGTLATLKEKLEQNAYHILHFSGHGVYSDQTKEGYLLMEDDKTFKKRFVTGHDFVEVLSLVPENRPELVVLSACESAKGFDSITQLLHDAGVPSVVSMNQSVLDYFATYFAAAFYKNIVTHLKSREPLSHSFALAIEALQQEEARRNIYRGQYLIPQLFTSKHIQNLVNYTRPQTHALKFSAVKFVTGKQRMLLAEQINYTFVGRRREIRMAMPVLQANKAVLLRGQGGVGKTALAEYLTTRLLLNDHALYPFMLDEKKTNIDDLSNAMLAFIETDLKQMSFRYEVKEIPEAVRKFWVIMDKIKATGRFPLFIFDNLESYQVDAGGHFHPKHGELCDLINDIIAQEYPVILTSRYPVPDFAAVTEVNLNEVAFGDFYRKAQNLKFYELRHILDASDADASNPLGDYAAQKRLAQEGSNKANFKQVMTLLHQTLGGNYRALEFFDNIYHTDSRTAYETLAKLEDFRLQLAQDSTKVREQLQTNAKSLVFDRLLALLTPDELRVLQGIEPFRVPVLPEAIQYAQNKTEQQPDALNTEGVSLQAMLKKLFDLTLIEQHQIGDDKQTAYYVAPLVRNYLQEAHLITADFDHKRAGDYFDKRLDTTKHVEDCEEAYYHYFTAQDKEEVNRYGCILCGHYFDKQTFRKAYDIGKQTEDFVGENTEGVTLSCLGQILQLFGHLDAALSYYERGLLKERAKGDRQNEGTTLNNISQIYDAKGNYDTALRYLEQSLTIQQEIGDRQGEGTTLNNISQIYDAKGDYDTALRYLEQSLTIRQEIGDRKGEGTTLNNISQIYRVKEDYDTALRYLEQSLTIRQEIGDRKGEGATLNNISQIYDAKGDYDTSLHYLQQSLSIQQEIGDRKGEGTTLNNISLIYDTKGDYDSALHYLEQSLSIQQEIGDIAGLATTLNNMGDIFWKQKQDAKRAIACFMQSYQIFKQIGSPNVKYPEGYLTNIIETIGEAQFEAILAELQEGAV